jgi:hypothetical protein
VHEVFLAVPKKGQIVGEACSLTKIPGVLPVFCNMPILMLMLMLTISEFYICGTD